MDLTEMLSRVRNVINDSAGTNVSDDEITDYLNEAGQDLAHRLRVLKDETTGTWSGTTLTLPTGLVEVISLRLGDDDDVRFVDDVEYWGTYDADSDVDPSIARIFEDVIEVYPTPSTGTAYRLRYVKEPTALSAGADESALPSSLHTRMVRYAQAMAHYKEGDDQNGDRKMAMYEQSLPEPPLGRTRDHPGPFTVQFEAGPFDILESQHI